MVRIEYGKMNNDVIILLHGGGLSWWNYREAAEMLKTKYHVVIPILDGHAGSDRDFTSIADCAGGIIKLIDELYNGSVMMIGGVSLGAQILVEILSRRGDICSFAVIESALVFPMKLTQILVKPMINASFGLIKQKWFSKLQFRSLKIRNELYSDYYRDTCCITKDNMIAFLRANAGYKMKKELEKTQARSYIFAGKKEQAKMKRSAYALHSLLPDSTLEILNLHHGEFSLNHAEAYSYKLMDILNS